MAEAKIEPIPVPTLVETDAPPLEGGPSAGLVAYSAPDDDSMVVRTVAYPRIVYLPDGSISIEPFEQAAAPQEYIVYDSGLGFRLRTDWQALWLSDSYGTGYIALDVYLQSPGGVEFEQVQYASTQPMEEWGPSFRNELLDATLYLPQAGVYRVRAIVTIMTYNADGIEVSREMVYETGVAAFSSPAEYPGGVVEDFQPAFGDLEEEGLLMDWRAWADGPCFVRVEDQTITQLLDSACVSFENDDWPSASTALQVALNSAGDDLALAGRLRDQLGMLAAAQEQWNVASRHFREAVDLWQALDDVVGVDIALHNLGLVLVFAGRWEEGVYALSQSGQLRDQIGDYPGALLTWAHLSLYWELPDSLDYVAQQMTDIGMPQAEFVWAWADYVWEQQAADESSP